MQRRALLVGMATLVLGAGPASAQWWRNIGRGPRGGGRGADDDRGKKKHTTAYVDRDPVTGRFYAVLNGRRIGPPSGFSTEAEAWAYLRLRGA